VYTKVKQRSWALAAQLGRGAPRLVADNNEERHSPGMMGLAAVARSVMGAPGVQAKDIKTSKERMCATQFLNPAATPNMFQIRNKKITMV